MFYSMLAGMTTEQKKTLCLEDASKYKFLTRVITVEFGNPSSKIKLTRLQKKSKFMTDVYRMWIWYCFVRNI